MKNTFIKNKIQFKIFFIIYFLLLSIKVFSFQKNTLAPKTHLTKETLLDIKITEVKKKYSLHLVDLLKEGQSIIDDKFSNPDSPSSYKIRRHEKRSVVENALNSFLKNHKFKNDLIKILTVEEDESYYSISFKPDFIDDVLISPDVFFDRWAFEKADELIAYAEKNKIKMFFLNSVGFNNDLLKIFPEIGITEEDEINRVSDCFESIEMRGPSYRGYYALAKKSLAALAKKERYGMNDKYRKWISLEDYFNLDKVEQKKLEEEFKSAFDVSFLKDTKEYPLTNDYNISRLLEIAKNFDSIIGINDRAVCLGRTPFYLLYIYNAINKFKESLFTGESEKLVQVSFTGGGWITTGLSPTKKQIKGYRDYLKRIRLSPQDIIKKYNRKTNPGKTIIIDYFHTGEGGRAFLSILMNWAEELEKKGNKTVSVYELQQALKLYNLRQGNEYLPSIGSIYDIPVEEIVTTIEDSLLFKDLADSNASSANNDGIKESYHPKKWDNSKIKPDSNEITYNGYLICAHILNYLINNGYIKNYSKNTTNNSKIGVCNKSV